MNRQNLAPILRQYAAPVLLQASGTAATLLLTLGLARYAGPDTQAIFAKFRYWSDFCLSLALFGLPQAYVYLINKRLIDSRSLTTFSGLYAAMAILPVFTAAWLSVVFGLLQPIPGVSSALVAAVTAVGVALLLYQRLIRTVELVRGSDITFSIVTALPAVTLLAIYIGFYRNGTVLRYDLLFTGGAVVSTAFSFSIGMKWRELAAVLKFRHATQALRNVLRTAPAIVLHSSHSVAQSLLFTGQPAASVWLLEYMGGRLEDISFLNIATLAIILSNLLFQYLSPLVFNRWSKEDARTNIAARARMGLLLSLIVGGAAAITAFFVPMLLTFVLGEAYQPAHLPTQLLTLAAAAVVFTRLMAPAIHGFGYPQINTASCVVRIVCVLVVQAALGLFGIAPLLAAAIGWFVGEWLAALMTYICVRRLETMSAR